MPSTNPMCHDVEKWWKSPDGKDWKERVSCVFHPTTQADKLAAKDCCSEGDKGVKGYCRKDEGNCKNNSECEGDLVCGSQNCGSSSIRINCCKKP